MLAPIKPAVAAVGALLLAPAFGQAAPAAGAVPRVAARQELVAVLDAHQARNRPAVDGRRVGLVRARRPITGARTVLPVLGHAEDGSGRAWLRVRLPGRRLGSDPPPRSGWIVAARTRRSTTAWHLLVDARALRVTVYRNGRRLRSYPAIVGKASTPTPLGEFFVEENVRLPAGHPGGPFALATSARSPVLQEFDGGPGQIALHGRENVGGVLGTAVSHGCVRLDDRAVTWLAARVAPGTPITIVRPPALVGVRSDLSQRLGAGARRE